MITTPQASLGEDSAEGDSWLPRAGLTLVCEHVRGDLIRILSDVHYGDRASQVHRLLQLQPLVSEADAVVFNGDTLDTRVGPHAAHTAACRTEVAQFAQAAGCPITFLTGNHDPDFSAQHWLDLAEGEVFVVHGDVLFDDIVPWGRDAREIRSRIAQRLGPTASLRGLSLEERLAIWREVARSIPQRHQSERHPVKYALRFMADTVWPPTRFFKIFAAWRSEPQRAAELARAQRPSARYVILGHTHRPSIRQVPGGPIVINTGSFTAPFGGFAVELLPGVLRVKRIQPARGEFRPGPLVAEFPLANRG